MCLSSKLSSEKNLKVKNKVLAKQEIFEKEKVRYLKMAQNVHRKGRNRVPVLPAHFRKAIVLP